MALTPEQEAAARALLAKGNVLGQQASQVTGVAYNPTQPATMNSQQLAQQAQNLGVQNVPQSLLQPQPQYQPPAPLAAAPPPAPLGSQMPPSSGMAPTTTPGKSLSFTGGGAYTPPPSSAPNFGGFQQGSNEVQWLPQQPGSGSGSLTDFAAALDQATGLAKQNRNALALGLMMPGQGTVAASDFNSILGNMNAASNNFSTDLVNKAMTAATPRYETQTIGNQIVQMAYDGSGKFIGSSPIAVLPEQYQYDSMTLPNGDVYYIQKDSQGRPIGQQLAYKNPEAAQNTYDYQTDDTGALFEYTYGPNGQMMGLKQVGQLPTKASTEASDYVYKTTYQAGDGTQWFMGVKADGSGDNYQLGGAPKPGGAPGGYTEVSPGATLFDPVTGQPVYTAPTTKSQNGGDSGSKPTAAQLKEQDRQEARSVLNSSKGSDGYVNTVTYVDAMNAWPGTPDDFFKEFPPSQYVNPDDPTVPLYIQDQMY